MLGTFVYRDRKPPAGTEIPDLETASRHQRIAAIALELQEGDNEAVKLAGLSPDFIYLIRPGAAHGAPAVLVVNHSSSLINMDPILGDIDALNNLGLSPVDLPAKAISLSFWHRVFPTPALDQGVWVVLRDEIHGGWELLSITDVSKLLSLRPSPLLSDRQAYGAEVNNLIKRLGTHRDSAEDR